jgi:hypothetical protein
MGSIVYWRGLTKEFCEERTGNIGGRSRVAGDVGGLEDINRGELGCNSDSNSEVDEGELVGGISERTVGGDEGGR